jgi:chromosome segregation ATPase
VKVINEDVKMIKNALPKLDEIEKSVKTIQLQMSNLEIKVKNLETKSTEAENSLAFINSAFENQKSELQESREQVNALQNKCIDLAEYDHTLQKQAENVQDKLLDLEERSMRSNLIFYGLNEPESPTPNDT